MSIVNVHLFQDKSKLLSQVRAQESVIQGLRLERKLWGEELAQQGNLFYVHVTVTLTRWWFFDT